MNDKIDMVSLVSLTGQASRYADLIVTDLIKQQASNIEGLEVSILTAGIIGGYYMKELDAKGAYTEEAFNNVLTRMSRLMLFTVCFQIVSAYRLWDRLGAETQVSKSLADIAAAYMAANKPEQS